MKRFFSLLGALLLLGVSIAPAVEPPNILLILVDDAGFEDFGFMGSPDLLTPHIDRLAAMGTVFSDAHVTATVCSPSRAGLLTGRYQQRFGHEMNVPPHHLGMDPTEHTLGDTLGEAGYRTFYIGKWHLGNRTFYHPGNRGFDEFYGFLEGSRSYFPLPAIDHPQNYRALLHNRTQVDFEGYLTDVFTDRAIQYLDTAGEQPWLLFLSYNAPHTPMHAKPEDLARFAGHPRQKLAAMMWSLDENIGRLTAALEARGELENTLIFFLSDNGGAGAHNNQSSNAPLKGWKGNKFEGGHRVPFFVTWKGTLPAGESFDGLTSALDLYATALAVSGLEATTGKPLDGVNLLPFLTGEATGAPHERLFWRKDQMAAMREGSLKLIRVEGLGYRLYDLAADPVESHDLRAERPADFARLTDTLIAWDRDMGVPQWFEDEDWNGVTYEIHRALMDNATPRYLDPSQRKAFEAQAK